MTTQSSVYEPDSRLRPGRAIWWVYCLLAIVAAGFGAYGLWQYQVSRAVHPDAFSIGYYTLQMFALNAPYLDEPIPWPVHAGRWLAAAVVFAALIQGLSHAFRSQVRLVRVRGRGGHVVICGLGRVGLQLAREFRQRKRRVVAIEADDRAPKISTARDLGAAVFVGDAAGLNVLRRAGVSKAAHIIAVCDDEQKNVAIAAAAGELVAGSRRRSIERPIECWILLADARLRRSFQRDDVFPHTGSRYRVNVRGLDLFELAARQAFTRAPLDYERLRDCDSPGVHLVIVGFGAMGQHLALQAAKIGHFATFKKLGITVVERSDNPRPAEFRAHYPGIADVCDFRVVPIPIDAANAPATVAEIASRVEAGARSLTTIAVCRDSRGESSDTESAMLRNLELDDSTNLSLALELNHLTSGHEQLLVFQTRRRGFGALFPPAGRGKAIGPRVHAFGMVEETCSLDALLHEKDDLVAKSLHERYCENQLKEGHAPRTKPALYPWDQLSDQFKDSNRQAADHIPVKLRALGYRMDVLRDGAARVRSLDTPGQIDILARMEHERWCAEWLLRGYTHGAGERNDLAKTHPLLVAWNQMDQRTQEWDREQVRAIPDALEKAGFGIYDTSQVAR